MSHYPFLQSLYIKDTHEVLLRCYQRYCWPEGSELWWQEDLEKSKYCATGLQVMSLHSLQMSRFQGG